MTKGQLRNLRMSNNKNRIVLDALVLASGFTAGWVAKRHIILKQSVPVSSEQMSPGDAPQPVRSEVLKQLKVFQAGYTNRDPQQLPMFMDQLFPRDKDIVVLGTDPMSGLLDMIPFHDLSMRTGRIGATSGLIPSIP